MSPRVAVAPPGPRLNPSRHRSRALVGVAALVSLAFPACAPRAADTGTKLDEQAPVVVTVSPLRPVTLRRTVPVIGTLHAYEDVLLAPKVDGQVVRVYRHEGDPVLPGDVLLEMDPITYELEVEVARRALEVELARLEVVELPAGEFDPDRVSVVAKARAALEEADRKLEVRKNLLSRGVGAKDEFDVAVAERKVAEAALRQTRTEVLAALATARRQKAALDTAEQRLRDTKLIAPTPVGWSAWAAVVGPAACPLRYSVAHRMVSEGEKVVSMTVTNAFRVVIDHVLKLRVAVPERYGPDVRVGLAVEVRVEAFPDRVFPGVVTRVNPTVDTQNRTFQVEVEVPNCDRKLKAGGFAKAEILTRTDAGVLTVPPAAVVTFAGVNKVFVAEGDRAKAVEVRLGQRDKDWVEVIGPVPPDARVITSGFSQLVDGSSIRIR
jgi:multidrug efflux pump subunit AcrA (membrane-fusion protein)